jgi:hypothetical protein
MPSHIEGVESSRACIGVATNESISWADSEDRFEISNDLAIGGVLQAGSTTAATVAYNRIGIQTPVSPNINGSDDLSVSGALEVGTHLIGNGIFYMDYGGPDGPQAIYFYDGGAPGGRSFRWSDVDNRFEINDALKLSGAIELNNTIEMDDDGPDQNQRIYFFEDGIPNGESFGWTDAADRFEFTDSVHIVGDLSATGAKPFVQNYPGRDDLSVVYAALEGDEVGTYTRGMARLTGGVAEVALGETFALVTHPDIGLTVQLTARSPGARLYVESVSTRELLVRAEPGSAPDAAFDYVVQGLRIGFENWDVVRPRSGPAPIPSQESADARHAAHSELRTPSPLERFGQMAVAAGGVASPSNEARALRQAIGEYDPDASDRPDAVRSPEEVVPGASSAAVSPPAVDRAATRDGATTPGVSAISDGAAPPLETALGHRSYEVLEAVEAGDVLVADANDPERLRRASIIADTAVVGIVAGEPGTRYDGSHPVPVAQSGIVRCRVDATQRPILRGELLVTGWSAGSASGSVDRAPGTILGKALESLSGGSGFIRVLVTLQ